MPRHPIVKVESIIVPGDLGLIPSYESVAKLMAQGMRNMAIAVNLAISEKTVEKYVADIYREIGIPTNSQYDQRVILARWWWNREMLRGGNNGSA